MANGISVTLTTVAAEQLEPSAPKNFALLADEIVAVKTVDGSQFRSISEIEQMQVSYGGLRRGAQVSYRGAMGGAGELLGAMGDACELLGAMGDACELLGAMGDAGGLWGSKKGAQGSCRGARRGAQVARWPQCSCVSWSWLLTSIGVCVLLPCPCSCTDCASCSCTYSAKCSMSSGTNGLSSKVRCA